MTAAASSPFVTIFDRRSISWTTLRRKFDSLWSVRTARFKAAPFQFLVVFFFSWTPVGLEQQLFNPIWRIEPLLKANGCDHFRLQERIDMRMIDRIVEQRLGDFHHVAWVVAVEESVHDFVGEIAVAFEAFRWHQYSPGSK